tara:strand:+ start:134 stop:391 length:258 start_codon:yes stop_codon:yes gene_type:complete
VNGSKEGTLEEDKGEKEGERERIMETNLVINPTTTSDTKLRVVRSNTINGIDTREQESHASDDTGEIGGGLHCCFDGWCCFDSFK